MKHRSWSSREMYYFAGGLCWAIAIGVVVLGSLAALVLAIVRGHL